MTNIRCRGKTTINLEELERIGIPHKNGWVYGTYLDGFIVNGVVEANEEYIAIENWCSIDKDTLGFYTAYKDMNDVPIYTGDIVKSTGGTIEKVIFDYGAFLAQSTRYSDASPHLLDTYVDFNFIKVIGNIYDNPELVRKENKDDNA